MESNIKLINPCPRINANIFSKLTFGWLLGIFNKCLNTGCKISDLYQNLPEDKSKKLCDSLERNWNLELKISKDSNIKPSLLRAIRKTFFWSYMLRGVVLLFSDVLLRSTQPLILAIFIGLFSKDENEINHNNRKNLNTMCMYGGLLVTISFALMFCHHMDLSLLQMGMRVRVACCSLIYRKMLRLNKKSLNNSASGRIINLLSNDVGRFELLAQVLHYIWIMPLLTAFITYLVWQQVEMSSVIGSFFLIISSVPAYLYASKLSYKLRLKIAAKTDDRVRKMAELISGIQVIKMYAWEKPFANIINIARTQEIDVLTWTCYIKGIIFSALQFLETAAIGITIISFVSYGHTLTAPIMFSVTFYFQVLQVFVSIYFPLATTKGAEALASIKRLQEFLLLEERDDSVKELNSTKSVILKNVRASWDNQTQIFDNLDMNVPAGNLCAIVGPVGVGKSTIFQLLLGELIPEKGSIAIGGKISYSSQEPWLFSSTIRDNILFGQKYDPGRYERVIKSCALESDLQVLPYGDQSLVGEKGVILSGGQKARINLARAVYRNADIYLLDDPLSAVDTHVGNHLFEECILGLLKNKTRILVTHQLQYLQKADHLVVMNNGKIEAQGNFSDVSKRNLDFAKLVGKIEQNTKVPETVILNEKSPTYFSKNKCDTPENEESVPLNMGRIAYKEYIRAGGNMFVMFGLVFVIIVPQLTLNIIDLWVTYWTQRETSYTKCGNSFKTDESTENIQLNLFETTNYSNSKYFYETHTSGINKTIANVCLQSIDTKASIYIYTGLILALAVFSIIRSIYIFKVTMNSSKNLHNKMFSTLLQVPMRFFDINPSGRILNRFSSDVGIIDELLSNLVLETLVRTTLLIGILVLVFITNLYMILITFLLAIAMYKIQRWHIRIAGNLTHLEGITRSPVFTHINDSLNGITTIRASSTEDVLRNEFDCHQDTHTSAWHVMLNSTMFFATTMDFLSFIFVTCVTFGFIIMNQYGAVDDSMVGLAVSQSLLLTDFVQFGMRQVADVVGKMTSVERVLEYTKLDKEGPQETDTNMVCLKNWPNNGEIAFHGINLRYSTMDEPVLKNVNFIIDGGKKVGIVGRTGAGKSSIIAALFRLVSTEGFVTIDDVQTDTIDLNYLRRSISIIPQDPVLFCATIRYNLDPFQEYSDDELWNALDTVELKDVVDSLEYQVEEAGNNFSVGQKQLVCLARAVLRKNKILVLDEATANVDPKTDALIQQTIRRKFGNYTVLTIAHRLQTVMDSDKILVMDAGRLVEFDHPHLLLHNSDGYLFKMVAQTGSQMAEQLERIAESAFLKSARKNVEDSFL